MNKAEFIAKFKDVLQRDEEINEEMHLDDIIEYDSMSQLNVVVLIDTEFGILITPEDLDECEKVKDIIVEQLGVDADQVNNEASFIEDLGADSLDTVELVMAFEEEFGAEIPDEDAEKLTSVGGVITYLKEKGFE